MALTKKQIAAKFLPNVLTKRLKKVTWSDVQAAIDELSDEDKNKLANRISKKDFTAVGRIIYKEVEKQIRISTNEYVTSMFEDNKLNMNELEQLLS